MRLKGIWTKQINDDIMKLRLGKKPYKRETEVLSKEMIIELTDIITTNKLKTSGFTEV